MTSRSRKVSGPTPEITLNAPSVHLSQPLVRLSRSAGGPRITGKCPTGVMSVLRVTFTPRERGASRPITTLSTVRRTFGCRSRGPVMPPNVQPTEVRMPHSGRRRLRVLMLSWEYPPTVIGGLGRHVEGLAAALAAAGHDVTVLTRGAPGAADRERTGPVRVVRVPVGRPPGGLDGLPRWT